jgi:hypothetical protein
VPREQLGTRHQNNVNIYSSEVCAEKTRTCIPTKVGSAKTPKSRYRGHCLAAVGVRVRSETQYYFGTLADPK